jgi:hypothetical protein
MMNPERLAVRLAEELARDGYTASPGPPPATMAGSSGSRAFEAQSWSTPGRRGRGWS